MTRVNIYITTQQKQALERLAARTGLKVAEHVRRAMDAYLRQLHADK